uniref:Peptidase S1 domain-containing protein n=1 Tax=Glossina brevipalpis TaxID=37001 RepID=A0A1A9WAU4_9MUSC
MEKITFFIILSVISFISTNASSATRVVGGEIAEEGQFPYQISMRRNGLHYCGGSILTKNFVLTAAHCVGSDDGNGTFILHDPKTLTVRAGSIDRFMGGVLVRVGEIVAHENYGKFLNDVALLRLEEPLIFSKFIQPIPLASIDVQPGENVTISGWGRLEQGGDIPRHLQWNTLTVISRSECKTQIGFNTDALVCLAHAIDNGACNGDSGGPATYNGEVIGIAGFVHGGCGSKYPDGYAKVYYHVDWIKKHSDL